MSKLNEVIDSLTNENVDEVKEKLTSEASVLSKSNRQLYERAKKAEGFEYNKDEKKWTKKEKPEPKIEPNKKSKEEQNKPTESQRALELSQKALLTSLGFRENEEQEYILDEAKRLDKDISEIVNDSYQKSKLKDMKDERKTKDGMPKGKGKSGEVEKDVDYWVKKGEMPTHDPALAEKVIAAKEAKDSSNKPFSDDLSYLDKYK